MQKKETPRPWGARGFGVWDSCRTQLTAAPPIGRRITRSTTSTIKPDRTKPAEDSAAGESAAEQLSMGGIAGASTVQSCLEGSPGSKEISDRH